jgi:hypothetical protein
MTDAAHMKLDVVCNALNRTLEIGNTTIENCSVKCGFSIDHAGKQW